MKSDRKQQILNTAIELFNQKGFSSISIRDISNELNISPGSLTYYFKKKKDIVLEINNQMMSEFLMHVNFDISDFRELDNKIEVWCNLQRKYMFVFCDFIVLTQTYPELQKLNRLLFDKYKKQLNLLLDYYISKELVKPEPIKGIYENLAEILNILLPLTISINRIIYREDYNTSKIKDLVWGLLIPIFTEKGLEEYKALKNYKL
ncbi:TetR/AcrR family transcriptional regulator [Tepidibacter hydrothermalis]|uniref:TetR family transcriptional regulator n=1 Tax=Tepidibacter hydrothermalis TaxID=3036126 RepID=A0ABY8E7N6_9FIRM|nr:TetR/AcrR family transcriptional regulator [Tepidibacter hydrothermalis]WFD08887.1 TetR family transcriptional regulator [Tepidibacter hydrothermalis]